MYEGNDRMVVAVTLGGASAKEHIFLTGGSATTLTLAASDGRVVADGHRGTELRVRAFDRNGTPTLVPGLSWDTPGGRIKDVSMPREGEYLADFVPDRARDPHREFVAVLAGADLRATTSLEVTPPPLRVLVSGRFGVFSNFGQAAGPVAFVEVLTPVPRRTGRFVTGLAVGYLRDDVTLTSTGNTTARIAIDQVPILAVARYRFITPRGPDLAAGGGVGVSIAGTTLTPDVANSGSTVTASAWSVALQLDAEAAFPLRPGQLVVGARYLWVDLGRTSHGDYVRGNVAGLMGDLGYRITW